MAEGIVHMKLIGGTKEHAQSERGIAMGSSCGSYHHLHFPSVQKRRVEKLTGIYAIRLRSKIHFIFTESQNVLG